MGIMKGDTVARAVSRLPARRREVVDEPRVARGPSARPARCRCRRLRCRDSDPRDERPRPVVEKNSILTLHAHVRAGVVRAVVAHTWLNLHPAPAGMRAAALVRPDVRPSIGLVWPDHRAEPLLTPALITTVREVDLVAVLDRSAASGR